MTLISPDITAYCKDASTPEPLVLKALREAIVATHPKAHNMIDPLVGRFLSFLVEQKKPKKILEIGTFGGYSTLWMGQTFRGERILTVDRDDTLIPLAKKHWEQAGVQDTIQFVQGAAEGVLKQLKQDGQIFDFFFIDANKKAYKTYFDLCLSLRAPGKSMIVVDNVLGFRGCHLPHCDHKLAQSLKEFNAYVAGIEGLTVQVLPLGDGLMIVT